MLTLVPVLPLAAQTARVVGTSVELAPPPGFVPSSRFPGFERADLQASIMVTEVPGPMAGLTRGMTASGLASRNMTLISSARPQMDGTEALLLHVAQSVSGSDVLKWILVVGDTTSSVMVVGTFPKPAEAALSAAIRTSVLSTRWRATAAPDQFEGLPFRVSGTPTLKIASRMSNMLLLTESGRVEPQGAESAVLAIGSSIGPRQVGDLRGFAAARVKQTNGLAGIRILQERPTRIDDMPAQELVAEGTDSATGRVVTVYQVVMPDGDGYVLMQGMVASTRSAVMIPEFRRVAMTFRRVGR